MKVLKTAFCVSLQSFITHNLRRQDRRYAVLNVFSWLRCFTGRCQYLWSIRSHLRRVSLSLSLWSRYARQLTSSAATVIGENIGVGGPVTIQEPCRGGDPEANLTEENSGIPGGTFRFASRLVRLIAPRRRQSVNIFYTSRKAASCFPFFFVAVVVVVVLAAAVVVLRQLPVCEFASTSWTLKTPFLVS
jgi:hypothetical protein